MTKKLRTLSLTLKRNFLIKDTECKFYQAFFFVHFFEFRLVAKSRKPEFFNFEPEFFLDWTWVFSCWPEFLFYLTNNFDFEVSIMAFNGHNLRKSIRKTSFGLQIAF